jgi:hypothetical protein
MAQQPSAGNQANPRAFMQKLGQFRKSLSPDEQRMLDALVIVAEGAHTREDVTGYTWLYQDNPIHPMWYEGTPAPDETSPWWVTFNNLRWV